jgi:hypothetical protein
MTKKSIEKREPQKKAVWLGAQRLMQRPQTSQEERERKLILLAAKVLGVSPFGVNILGSLPYINKLGLTQKLSEYAPNARLEYEWVKFAEDDIQKAICKARVVDANGKPLCDWVVGECSPSTQRMGTLKGYQNHMAQTRARNRAILEAFGVRIHEEMLANIEELYGRKEITDKEVTALGSATTTSAEEVQEEKKSQAELSDKSNVVEKLKVLAREHGAKAGEEKKFLEEKVGHTVNFTDPSERYFTIIKSQLLAAIVQNKEK